MATIVNLDEVVVQRTEISKTIGGVTGGKERRTWSLRDDIPTETMLRCFELMEHSADRSTPPPDADESTADAEDAEDAEATARRMMVALRQRMEAQIAETLDVFTEIWQHTYPDTTRDELRAWFTHDEREGIVQLFFTRRLTGSAAPSSSSIATATATAMGTLETAAAGQENRAVRRQRSSRAKSSGAIPSQKRLSRQLKGAGL